MRKDLKHVIIDTARRGSGHLNYRLFRRSSKFPKDSTHESMGFRTRSNYMLRKDFGDRIEPLWRSIRKHVNKPWDEVWSMLCKSADHRSIRGHHLRQHVKDMVELRTYYGDDGRVTILPEAIWSSNLPTPIDEYVKSQEILYVDPEGILRVRPPVSKKTKYGKSSGLHKDVRIIDDVYYGRINNCWFELEMASSIGHGYFAISGLVDDAMFGEQHSNRLLWHYGKRLVCVGKTQLNKRQLKRLKLKRK